MVVSYIDFVEERLDIGIDYGAVGGMSFQTEIVNSGDETEQRNCTRWLPLGRWQLGQRIIYEGDDKTIDEVNYLRDFHRSRKGSKQGFRYKDWTDYSGVNQHIGTTDGVTTQWQLTKRYYAGSYFVYRPIIKPVEGTVNLYLDGNLITSPAINHYTGVISFLVPPAAGQVITADFEFDVPVTFEKDEISWKLRCASLPTGEALHELGSVFVTEMKINLFSQWHDLSPLPNVLFKPLDLGTILDTNKKILFSTRSESLASGFKSSLSNRDSERYLLELPSHSFDEKEIAEILSYFWAAKGRLIKLKLILNSNLYLARFNSDSFSAKFKILQDGRGLWETNLSFFAFNRVDKFPDFKIILLLFGDNYVDFSDNNHSVFAVGNVPITNNSLNLDSPSNYLEIPAHPDFNLLSDDFYIEFDFLAFSPLDNCYPIAQYIGGEDSFFVRFFDDKVNIALSHNGIGGQAYSATLPDTKYFGSFQKIKIVKSRRSDPNFDEISFYYGGVLIEQKTIAAITLFSATTTPLTIGKQVSGFGSSGNYLIKNLVVAKKEVWATVNC